MGASAAHRLERNLLADVLVERAALAAPSGGDVAVVADAAVDDRHLDCLHRARREVEGAGVFTVGESAGTVVRTRPDSIVRKALARLSEA